MSMSARLEIHVINVSQGDSVVVINRDLAKVAAAIAAKVAATPGGLTVPADPIDHVPFAIRNKIDLTGTVVRALLIDGGPKSYGGTVVDYLRTVGVLPAKPGYVEHLTVLLSHHHADHFNGLTAVLKRTENKTVVVPHKKTGAPLTRAVTEVSENYRAHTLIRPEYAHTKNTGRTLITGLDEFLRRSVALSARYKKPTRGRLLGGGGIETVKSTAGAAAAAKGPAVFDLGKGVDGLDITVSVLAAAQAVWNPMTKKVDRVKNDPVDQNDRSISIVVEYGSFRFYAAGDIAGNGAESGGNRGLNKEPAPPPVPAGGGKPAGAKKLGAAKKMSGHADVESLLGPACEAAFPRTVIPPVPVPAGPAGPAGPPAPAAVPFPKCPNDGQVTVIKASHHGSRSSNDVHLLATLRPAVAVVSAGVKQSFYAHPTQEVMHRLDRTQNKKWEVRPAPGSAPPATPATTDNTVQGVYVTEVAEKARTVQQKKVTPFEADLYGAAIVGDIVVRPTDESVSAVQKAAGFGTDLVVRVHGTGRQSGIGPKYGKLRDTRARNASTVDYPIGPFDHVVRY
jgi:beta-lactamase superfamily II metal-dependent hydrolase